MFGVNCCIFVCGGVGVGVAYSCCGGVHVIFDGG